MEQKSKKLMIFLAGELQNKDNIRKLIAENDFDFYAADGGYAFAKEFAVPLRKVLGDFDSIHKPQLPDLLVYPSEKDETDAELALNLALEEGYQEIWFIAPFGGRLDHTVANLHLLEKAKQKNVSLKLYDGVNLAFLLEQGTHIISKYRYVSFFPWGQSSTLSLKGFKYPLDHYFLTRAKPIGISNELLRDLASVEVHYGTLLCICVENEQEDL